MIRLIATDMDGTLIRKDGTIHEGMVPLIRSLKKKGIVFAVVSGRPVFNLHARFSEVQKEIGVISLNGAYVEWDGKSYPQAALERDVCVKAVEAARSNADLYCLLDGKTFSYVEALKTPYHEWDEAKGWTKQKDLMEVVNTEKIYRIKLVGYEHGKYPTSLEGIIPEFRDKAEIIHADVDGVDLSGLGNNKGNALRYLQSLLDITPEDTLVFGDYYNDLPMFQYAGYRVAVKNACPELKALATHVIGHHDEDSVFKTIETVYRKGDLQ